MVNLWVGVSERVAIEFRWAAERSLVVPFHALLEQSSSLFFSSLWWLLIFFFEIVIDDTHALLLMSLARCSFVPSRKLLNKKFNHWANYLVFISTISLMVSSLFIALFRNVFRVFALFSSVDPSIFVNYTRTWSVTPILYILLFKLFIFRRRFSCLLLQTFFLHSFTLFVCGCCCCCWCVGSLNVQDHTY